jgi:hypothetical protein
MVDSPRRRSHAVVRIQPADDFTADHVDIRDGDVWELDYSLHTRTVTVINRRRDISRRYVYRGGTRNQLVGGGWEEIVPPKYHLTKRWSERPRIE